MFSNIESIDIVRIVFNPRTYLEFLRPVKFPFWIFSAAMTTQNWYDLILVKIGAREKVCVFFRDGEVVGDITRQNFGTYNVLRRAKALKKKIKVLDNGCEFLYKKKKVRLFGAESQYYALATFLSEEYSHLHCKKKDVFDIGANIGDSAIYFALNGARHIYAFEPHPSMCSVAKKNVEMNDLRKKISIINAGLGDRCSRIYVDQSRESFGGSDLRKDSNCGKLIRVLTLAKAFCLAKNKRGVLKIDCEGCEYDTVLASERETLRKFDEIYLEYHYGYLNIARKIESSGFRIIKCTAPSLVYNEHSSKRWMLVGTLYARRD